MLDLILHEAVSSVVRHLTTNVPTSRSDSEAQAETVLQESDSCTNTPSRRNTATDENGAGDETSQSLLGITTQIPQYPEPPTSNHPRYEHGSPSENEIHSQTFATQQVLDPSPPGFGLELFLPSSNLQWAAYAEQSRAILTNDLLSPAR